MTLWRRARIGRSAAAIALLVATVVACNGPVPSPSAVVSFVPADPLPSFGHVWVIVLENAGYDRIVGSAEAPFLNGLIAGGGLAQAYSGVGRPSQPNYLALFSGSTHGIADNDPHDVDAPTLADQLEEAGRSWAEYAENVPPDCFTGAMASGGRDGPGDYVRKHAPAISFDAIRNDPVRCGAIQDLSAFEPGATDFALIIPNLCHDLHDCSLEVGDAWLADVAGRIIASEAYRTDGLLVVTFDEGEADAPDGGRIATILTSPWIRPGTTSAEPHDHYSLLRTLEAAWGLPCLQQACAATTLAEFFTDGAAGPASNRAVRLGPLGDGHRRAGDYSMTRSAGTSSATGG